MKTLRAAIVTTLVVTFQQAAAATPSKCTSREIGAAGKKAATKAMCWAKATSKGVAVDPKCLSGAEGKFSATYPKAQAKGDCAKTTTAGTIETTVDDFITDLVTEINGNTGTPTVSKCSSKELAAAGKKAGALLKCYAKAAAKGDSSIIAPCISTAQGKFGTAWTKAMAAGGCKSTVDQATIETKVDNFATDVNGQLASTGTTTTTTMCIPTTCAAQGAMCGTIPDGCGQTLDCGGTCNPGQCCDSHGQCESTVGALTCRAADGTCASSPSANCPCCSIGGTCVSSCGPGECCSSGSCESTTAGGPNCRATDGTCASPPSANCACCDSGSCVSSCGEGACCGSGVCQSTLGAPFCQAADGSCELPGPGGPDTGCACCSAGFCVSSCGAGQCCAGGACTFAVTCAEFGLNCGSIDDRCGSTLDCGTCTAPETCGGGGTPNVCGCTDNGAACTGRICGSAVNNCGQHVSCGTCPTNTPKCCIDSCVCSTCQCP
jgi:hypothetical protein